MSNPILKDVNKKIKLSNSKLCLEFSEFGNLIAFSDSAKQVCAPIAPDVLKGIFSIVLRDGNGELHEITSGMEPPEIKQITFSDRQSLAMRWSLNTEVGKLQVLCKITLPDNSQLSYWSIGVENSTDAAIYEIHFPRISGLTGYPQPGENWLTAPLLMGCNIPEPVAAINRDCSGQNDNGWAKEFGGLGIDGKNCIAYSYPGMWTMQFLAYGHPESGGIYFGAHDSQALYKKFGLYAGGDTGNHAALVMKQYPEDRLAQGRNFYSFFETAVGIYPGEWWNASKIYRNWAVNQTWAKKGPVKDRSDIPEWILNTDLWYWNHHYDQGGHPKIVIPAIEYLKKYLDANLTFHWYGYNGEQFDTYWRYPEMVPDNPDIRERLRTGIEELHKMGVKCLPYINSRLWNPEIKSFRDADGMEQISVDENGNPSHTWGYIGHTVCPTSKPFHELITSQVERLMKEFGMDGAYLDQLSGCYAAPCFNPGHDHGVGGHDHWHSGYRKLLKTLRAGTKSRNPDAAFSSESTIECFMDLLDIDLARELTNLNLTPGNTPALPVPMFISVYHDYHLTYGSVSKMVKAQPAKYRYAESLCFTAGQQLMIGGFFKGDERRELVASCLKFMKTLTNARKPLRNWLNFGQWLPPVKTTCGKVNLDPEMLNPLLREIPAVVSGCFRLNNQVLIVLVNHSENTQTGDFSWDRGDAGIKGLQIEFRKIYPEASTCEYQCNGSILQVKYKMQPESVSAYLIELKENV